MNYNDILFIGASGGYVTFTFLTGITFIFLGASNTFRSKNRPRANLWYVLGWFILSASLLFVAYFSMVTFFNPRREHLLTQFYYITLATILTPFISIISHTLRFGSIPTWRQYHYHLLPLVAIPIHAFTQWEGIFWLVLAYVITYCTLTLANHIRWCRSRKDLWDKYDSIYYQRSVWYFFRIYMPILLYYGIIITSYFRLDHSHYISITTSMLLWIITIFYAYSYKDIPYDDEQLMSATENGEIPSVDDNLDSLEPKSDHEEVHDKVEKELLSPEMREKIAQRLAQAEQEKLHLKKDASVPLYSQFIGTNRTYLACYLKQEYGTTFTKYIEMLRFKETIRLLESDEVLSPALLCRKSGFSDLNTFYRRFKANYGCNPMQYREKIKN